MTPARLHPSTRRATPTPPDGHSVGEQVYRWPWMIPAGAIAAIIAGAIGLVASVYLILSSETIVDAGRMSVGFVAAVFAGVGLLCGTVALFVAAREVRFTIDHVEVHRLGRRTLRLAYSRYERDWVADCHHTNVVRLLVMRGNTACTLYLPPEWLREALDEIARIQAEEGWYDPAF